MQKREFPPLYLWSIGNDNASRDLELHSQSGREGCVPAVDRVCLPGDGPRELSFRPENPALIMGVARVDVVRFSCSFFVRSGRVQNRVKRSAFPALSASPKVGIAIRPSRSNQAKIVS